MFHVDMALCVTGFPDRGFACEPNQVIDSVQSVPDKITISFTETPEPRASSIKVVNSNNERIDNNDLQLLDSEKSLSVSLEK